MSRILRMTIVLGIVLVAIGMSIPAVAGELQSDASDRALGAQQAVLTDSHNRVLAPTASGAEARRLPADAHERARSGDGAGPIAAEDTGWNVSLTDVLLAVAIGIGVVAAGVLLARAIRRHPPRGHPPVVHR